MQLRRVVVTGLGTLTPIGNDVPSFYKGLQTGISGAGLITHFDTEKFKVKFACEVKNFNPEDFFDRKEARKMDPFTQFAMVAADEAINHSGLLQQSYNPDRIGVIWGAGIGGLTTFFAEIVDYAKGEGTPRFSPFFIPKMIVDIAPGYISIKHGFRGPNFSTVSACASSTHALIDAFNYIRLGKADAIVAGGSEASVNEPSVGGFSNMKALSERNDDFLTASRPFDKDRDGFVMGEGAAAMILEDYEHAKARGAKIYAEIVGGGMTADAYHLTAPHPEGLGACNVMKAALEDAGMTPADIDYINVHGTSTPLGDIAESKAILSVFGEHAYKLNISSTKSMTGHLLGGAGAIESLACIMAVSEDVIPPTINHFTDDPEFDTKLNFTFNVAQKRTVRAALSNTFGFGGHNASVIFKKFEG
ncbi:MAG: beta-ketoacyl-ACP synthase II [Bacteroidota bacterium]